MQFGEIQVSKYCYFCVRTRDSPTYYDRGDRHCSDSDGRGHHYIKLPLTDFFLMYDWLVIGEKNGLKIRNIHLHFSHIRWTKFLSDNNIDGRPRSKPLPFGGDYADSALGLNTVRITFKLFTPPGEPAPL